MYIQNRRNSSKLKGCSPLKNCNGDKFEALNYPQYEARQEQKKLGVLIKN